MLRLSRSSFLSTLVLFIGALITNSFAADATSVSESSTAKAAKSKIVPLVTLKPGETKELLLTTYCTVGATRSEGFQLTEMRDGKSVGERKKTYSRAGVTISVPGWDEAEKFAALPKYALLRNINYEAFVVTVTASNDAKPELFEMHLADATCSGQCDTDFRVLVTEP